MKISFVIPARNEEKFIAPTLRAILAQPQELVQEIIVVNNGSTDRTVEVIKSISDRIKIINQPIPGLPITRMTGFKAATGDIIASIDADTILPVNWAEKVVAEFISHPQVAMVSGPYNYELGGVTGYFLKPSNWVITTIPIHLIINWLRWSGIIMGGNFAMRRQAVSLLKNYVRDVKFINGEDCYMAKSVRKLGPIVLNQGLTVKTSPRRLQSKDMIYTLIGYQWNLWSVLFTGLPVDNLLNKRKFFSAPSKNTIRTIFGYGLIAAVLLIFWSFWLKSEAYQMPMFSYVQLLISIVTTNWLTIVISALAMLSGVLISGSEIFNQAGGGILNYAKHWWYIIILGSSLLLAASIFLFKTSESVSGLSVIGIPSLAFWAGYLAIGLVMIIYIIFITVTYNIILLGNVLWLWTEKAFKILRKSISAT